jgi:hypothetical protein
MSRDWLRELLRGGTARAAPEGGIAGALRPRIARAACIAMAALTAAPDELAFQLPRRAAEAVARIMLGRGTAGPSPAEDARWLRIAWGDGAGDAAESVGAAAETLEAAVDAWLTAGGAVAPGMPRPSLVTAVQVLRGVVACADAAAVPCAPAVAAALACPAGAAGSTRAGVGDVAIVELAELFVARLRADQRLPAAAADDLDAAERPLLQLLEHLRSLPGSAPRSAARAAMDAAIGAPASLCAHERPRPVAALVAAACGAGGG